MTTNIEPRETGMTADGVDTLDEMLRNRVRIVTVRQQSINCTRLWIEQADPGSDKLGRKGRDRSIKSLPWWTSLLTAHRKE
jgi:hypothetical protein